MPFSGAARSRKGDAQASSRRGGFSRRVGELSRWRARREVEISCGSSSTSGVNGLPFELAKECGPADSDASPKSDVRDDAALKPGVQCARRDAQHVRDFGFGEELGFRGKLASGLRVIDSHATGGRSTAPTCACVKSGRNGPKLSGNAECASKLITSLPGAEVNFHVPVNAPAWAGLHHHAAAVIGTMTFADSWRAGRIPNHSAACSS